MEKKDYMKRLCFYTRKIRRMLSVLFLFVFMGINALRADTIVEKVELNISVKNASVLQVFAQIKQQTSFNFVYNDRDISQIGLKTMDLKKADIVAVLDKCIEGTDLVYEFMGNVVIFKRRAEVVRDSVKEGKIVGVVKDERGFPLPGVTIQIKDMKLGTATDKDGRYAFRFVLGKQIVLEYSFIGMETVEIRYTGQDTINVVMKESEVALEDVVVTGYANLSRQSYTGNVKTMTAAELKKISQVNVLKSIQVLDPSFRIAVNNEMGSNPNVMPKISIRGDSGIGLTELDEVNVSKTALQNNPNLPTFILDGFEVSVNKVYDMDINRIESITLLKDAAATAIYGSRAANGVVVITTVTPKDGQILINYGYNLNVQVPDLRDYNLMNAKEKVEAEKEAGLFDQEYYQQAYYHAKLRLIERGNNTDWLALPLRNTASSKHYLRMEGGTNGFRYGIDVNYQGNNGVMKGSERKTFGLGLELQYNIGKLLFKNSATYTGVNSEESPFGSFSKYTTMNPYYSYLDEDGTVAEVIKTATPNGTTSNPLYDAYLGSFDKTKSKEFIDNFSVQYYLTNKIHFKGSLALTYTTGSSNAYTSPEAGQYHNKPYKGEMTVGNTTATVIDGSVFGYYNDMIGYHNINLFAGINVKESSDESHSVYVRDIPAGGFANPQFAREFPNAPTTFQQKTRLFGTIVSLNYTYRNIYLLDATWRMDGNSSFGSETRFAPFWSMGLGLNIHNYAFMKGVNWLSELKIRGSYGVTGKANFPANTARTLYTINSKSVYPTGLGGNITAMGNKNLKWEKTKITDLGTTINILDGLLVFTGTYYFRRTVDLIADMYIPSSSGFLSYKDNIGEITNNGYEISLRVKALAKSDAQLYFTANVASNKNKIKKISESLKSYNQKIEEKYQDNAHKIETKKPLLKYVEGASTTSIYAMRSLGINPQTGDEIFRYKDGSYGTEWLASENVAIGNTEPKMNGTLSSNLLLYGVTLDVYFTYTYGGQQYNQTLQTKIENADIENNVDKRVFTDRWKKQGDIAGFKSLKQYNVPTNPTSRFVQDDNTLTLQSVSVGYELPSDILKKIRFSRVKLAFNMNDVFRVSSIKQERGLSYPFARSYSFSVNVGF
ncbi:SusC/RagA family TonB-linked outer membrane protein [Butyricimonas muris]|uniref:SusC/RagA family TonB-linked outer membrane protein n=1 Tax=Butyricimonas muris TaxID=3378067 RepID=UPI003967B045